ncbi:MAG: OprO/OprP family phosphate-selective porin [Myxococcota bacterium]
MNTWMCVGGALVALCVAAPGAAATDGDKSVNEKILDILLEKGDITQERYDELREEALEEQKAAALPPVAAGESEWKVYWDNGTRIERKDGSVKIKAGGRIQYDFAGAGLDGKLKNLFPDAEGTGTDVRRARIFVSGSFGEHVAFKAQYDFAGGDTDFKDVWVGLQKLPVVGRVRAGHFKEPMSLEMTTSSKYFTFMERGLPVLAFTSERNAGIGFDRTLHEGRMMISGGVFQNVGDDAEEYDNQGNYNAGLRVTGLPWYEDDGKQLVHVGGWYSHQFRHDEMLRYNPDAESNTVGSLVNMPVIQIDDVDLLGAELAALCGPFFFESEFIAALVDGNRSPDSEFYGSYVSAGTFLGGRKKYDNKSGSFGRSIVDETFSPENGQWGALELAARWSFLTLNDGRTRGGILNNMTLGANWYLFPNLRLMVNYVLAHRNGVGNAHIAQSRISLDF